MFCRFCGKEISDDTQFCGYCGKKLSEKSTESRVVQNLFHFKVIVIPVLFFVALILLFVFIRSCGKKSVDGIWAYDNSALENTGNFDLGTGDLILYLHSDGSIETNSLMSLKSHALVDGKLKLVRPLGSELFYDCILKGDKMILVDDSGNTAVFKKCKTIDAASEFVMNSLQSSNSDSMENTIEKNSDSDEEKGSDKIITESISNGSKNSDELSNRVFSALLGDDIATIEDAKKALSDILTPDEIERTKNDLTYYEIEVGGISFRIPGFMKLEKTEDLGDGSTLEAYLFGKGLVCVTVVRYSEQMNNKLVKNKNDAEIQESLEYIRNCIVKETDTIHLISTERYEKNGIICIKDVCSTDSSGKGITSTSDTYCFASNKGVGCINITKFDGIPEEFLEIVDDIVIDAGITP